MDISQKKKAGNERTRGPNLAIFVKRYEGVCMETALAKIDETDLVIASNNRVGMALVGSEEWRGLCLAFGCWTGTMTAYDKPDKKLEETIEYTDPESEIRYVFPVPEEHQGKKNIVLVAEHPDFTLEIKRKTRVVHAKEIGSVSDFPIASGWYLSDPKYDIPTGAESDIDNKNARYLWRTEKRVGLVVRDYVNDWEDYYRRVVNLKGKNSMELGVAVESDPNGKHLSVIGENGKLIIEGTPAQISAAARLLEHLKVGK